MKEKILKLGVLATALVLAFVFAACAQPTEEVGPGTPAIIRLYLDRPETKTLTDTDVIYLRAGESFSHNLAGASDAERIKLIPLSGTVVDKTAANLAVAADATNLESGIPEVGYFESGKLALIKAEKVSANSGVPIAVTTNAQYYVDFELVNHTMNVVEKGSNLDGSYSLYLELSVTGAAGVGNDAVGGMGEGYYYYTPEKTSLNDWDGTAWTTDHRNIQTVDIGPGINELYLSQFSNE